MNWSDKPSERLRQLKSMGDREKEEWRRRIAPPAKNGCWPYGMPSSAAPLWVAIGLTPGAGAGSFLRSPKGYPKFGDLPGVRPDSAARNGDGLFWNQGTDYFEKVRQLLVCLGKTRDASLTEDQCLALSGHFNLGTGRSGKGDRANLERDIIRWVSSILANDLRPDVVVLLGWWSRRAEIAKDWKHAGGLQMDLMQPTKPPVPFETRRKAYKFRIWDVRDAHGRKVSVILWPNHPRKHPFASPKQWKKSLDCLPRVLSA